MVADARQAGKGLPDPMASEIEVLLRVAYRLAGNWPDAEDLVRSTLLKAPKQVRVFDGPDARSRLLAILRQTHLQSTDEPGLQLTDPIPTEAEEDPTDGESLEKRTKNGAKPDGVQARVHAAFRTLPADMQSVVLLVDVEGLSYKETAAVLGLLDFEVADRLHAARMKIRAQIGAQSHGTLRSRLHHTLRRLYARGRTALSKRKRRWG